MEDKYKNMTYDEAAELILSKLPPSELTEWVDFGAEYAALILAVKALKCVKDNNALYCPLCGRQMEKGADER